MLKALLTTIIMLAGNLLQAASLAITLTDQSGQPVEDAVVYVLSIDGQRPLGRPLEIAVDQLNETFVPHVRAATTGSSINFPNSDHIRHHVYSFSEAKTFELPLYIGIPAEPVVFDKPGIVTLGCNIHDHMLGYILIVDSPYFAEIHGGNGQIDGLPAGELLVEIWHPRLTTEASLAQSLTVTAEGRAELVTSIELRPERMVRRAPRRSGARY